MSDFTELDPPRLPTMSPKWYIGTLSYGNRYLHNDLLLHAETVNSNGDWNGLFVTELEAYIVSKQYYDKHSKNYPYEIRYQELLGSGQTNNTTSYQSETMVFK